MSRSHHARYEERAPFVTKDGSSVRELMHPAHDGCRKQSLAEAVVAPGAATALHRHRESEELYHVVAGHGLMTLGESAFAVGVGDTICIPPGTPHCIVNTGECDLCILCCCAPAYDDRDTELL